nr:vegetative cell wall protein gp1-like [Aegilops tauschii subsp. strangulata]
MRARLHSRLLRLALLPPCYCGSAEHPTMPALQLALGHTRVLVVPAARARLLPQPSQLQPLMHPGLLSLRAPAPVLARRPSSASSNACRVVLAHRLPCLPGRPDTPAPAPAGPSSRLGHSAIDHAGRRARPPSLHASRPPCAEAGCSVRAPASPWAGCCSAPASPSASASLYYARRLPSSASRRRRRLASLPTSSRRLRPQPSPLTRTAGWAASASSTSSAGSPTPPGRLRLLHEQRRLAHSAGPPPRATSQDRLGLLRQATSSHRLGRARACPTSSPAASGSPVPPRAQPGPVSVASTYDRVASTGDRAASCAPPRWLRPACAWRLRPPLPQPCAGLHARLRQLADSAPTRTAGSAACRLRPDSDGRLRRLPTPPDSDGRLRRLPAQPPVGFAHHPAILAGRRLPDRLLLVSTSSCPGPAGEEKRKGRLPDARQKKRERKEKEVGWDTRKEKRPDDSSACFATRTVSPDPRCQ